MNDRQHGSHWICCPRCGGKTRTKVYEDTVLINFPLYCAKCKQEIRVNVVKLKMVLSDEPDA
jgi:NAD-dependent SIR2 family protein deacetylase